MFCRLWMDDVRADWELADNRPSSFGLDQHSARDVSSAERRERRAQRERTGVDNVLAATAENDPAAARARRQTAPPDHRRKRSAHAFGVSTFVVKDGVDLERAGRAV